MGPKLETSPASPACHKTPAAKGPEHQGQLNHVPLLHPTKSFTSGSVLETYTAEELVLIFGYCSAQ